MGGTLLNERRAIEQWQEFADMEGLELQVSSRNYFYGVQNRYSLKTKEGVIIRGEVTKKANGFGLAKTMVGFDFVEISDKRDFNYPVAWNLKLLTNREYKRKSLLWRRLLKKVKASQIKKMNLEWHKSGEGVP